ncbi:MAG: rhomboid family intramembrane serine protease [Xanthomonadales bacterium]|nr:rhomboid family intramembrane serine protease [Xanthomonadales bacterium]
MRIGSSELICLAILGWSLLAWRFPALLERSLFSTRALCRGEWWRLLGYGFVHADAAHLLFNLIALFSFGRAVAPFFDRHFPLGGFLGFYLSALPVALIPALLRHRRGGDYRALGASGAVSAVVFAFVLFEPRALLLVLFVPMPAILFALLFLAYGLWGARRDRGRIAHEVHLAGACWGLLVAVLLAPGAALDFPRRLLAP